jgi:hypothetical protein
MLTSPETAKETILPENDWKDNASVYSSIFLLYSCFTSFLTGIRNFKDSTAKTFGKSLSLSSFKISLNEGSFKIAAYLLEIKAPSNKCLYFDFDNKSEFVEMIG